MGQVVAAARLLWQAERGQDLLEYALLASLIALVAVGAVTQLGNAVSGVLWSTIAQNF